MRMVSAAGSFAPHALCAGICQLSVSSLSLSMAFWQRLGCGRPAIAVLLLLRNAAGVIGSQERPAELI